MKISFVSTGWEDYLYWQRNDKQMLKRVNLLIEAITTTPFEGIGKPEPLKLNLAGYWSRRINSEHRLVYAVDGEAVVIIQCRGHYED